MKTTSEVKAELARRGVDTSGLLERSELEEALASSDYYAEASANQGAHAYCRHCGGGDDSEGNDILLCDGTGCPEAWHMQCLTPRLRKIPKGLWLCPTCSAQARDKNEKRSVAAMSLGAIKAELVERKISLARGLEKEEAILALVAARRKEEHATVDNAPPASSPLKRKAHGASDDEDAMKSPGATLNDTLAQLKQMQRVQQQRDAREAEARQAREAVEKAAARAAERAAVEKAEREAAEAEERKAAEEALKAAEEEAGQAAEQAEGQVTMETTSAEIASGSGSGNGDGSGGGGGQVVAVDECGATAAGTAAAKLSSAARDGQLTATLEVGGETELGSGSPTPRQGKRQKVGSGADRAEPSAEPSQREPSQVKSSQAKPSQAKPSRAKSKGAKPSQREPSTTELATTIQLLLRGEDLETITSREVRVRLEAHLELNEGALAPRKAEVNRLIQQVCMRGAEAAWLDRAGHNRQDSTGQGRTARVRSHLPLCPLTLPSHAPLSPTSSARLSKVVSDCSQPSIAAVGKAKPVASTGTSQVQPSPAKASPVKPSPVKPSPAKPSPAKPSPAKPSPAKPAASPSAADGESSPHTSAPLPSLVAVHVEALDCRVYALEMKRKHLSSADALAKALGRALPDGAAPTLEQLVSMRMKYEGERGGEKHAEKVRVDLTAEGAMQRAAAEARSIFVWPRKAKE